MGERKEDIFNDFEEALLDYYAKKEMDRHYFFDDRFSVGIEDEYGNPINLGKCKRDRA